MDRKALFDLSYGVYVVSTKDGERNVGCIVNSVFQVTSTPATLAVSINKDNFTNPCVLKSGMFTLSILSQKAPESLIGTFGFRSGKDTDKFGEVAHTTAGNGMPALVSDVCGYIECRVLNSMDCFTHTVIWAEITDARKLAEEPPMTYAYYHTVIKGKAPKNAPTYVPPDAPAAVQEEKAEGKNAYVCKICGYVHPGTEAEFEALPPSYKCPICSAPKSEFRLTPQ